MSKAFKYFITRSYTIFILSFFVFSFSILKVSAVYYATDNVTNPSCAPGDVGCYVSLNTLDQNIRIWNATGHDMTSVGIGTLALDTITGADNYNYAIGEESMRYATGSGNYGFGWYTLRGDGTNTNNGSRNIGIGEGVLNKLRSGSDNIGIGNASFNSLTTGSFNISIGRSSQRFLTTGSSNTSLGYGSLINNITGSGNVTFGYNSATTTTGSYNTIIGYGGGQTLSTGSYNISIGQNAQLPSDTGSGQLNIGNLIYGTGIYSGATATSTPVTSGMIGIGVVPTATLDVLYDSTTDERMTFGGAGRLNIIRYGSDQAIRIQRANGTSASQTHVLLGENIGQFGFEGYRANASFGRTFDISIQASEDYSGSSYGSTASFLKVKTGGSSRYPYMYTDGNNRTGFTSGSSGFSGTIPSTLYALGEGSTSGTYGFQVQNSTGTNNAFVVRDDGNVGIGTSTPSTKLDLLYNLTNTNSGGINSTVNQTVTSNGSFRADPIAATAETNISTGITNSGSLISLYTGSFRNGSGVGDNGTLNVLYGQRLLYGHLNNDLTATPITNTAYGLFVGAYGSTGTISNMYDIYLATNTTGATISNHYGLYQASTTSKNYFGGYVGIGTTTPSANLHIEPSTGTGEVWQWIKNSRDTASVASLYVENNSGMNIALKSYGSTYASTIFGLAAANTMSIMAGGANNGLFIGHSASSKATIFGQGSIENMRIHTNGFVGIANPSPSYTLHVGSSSVTGIVSRFQNSTGTCDINPTTTSLSCSSDRTLKTNITNLNNTILNQITSLQPVTYTWINDNTNQQQTGFIAQDVEQIFPSLVSTDPTTNLKSLNYIGLIPYAIEGIRELDIKVNQQASLDTEIAGSFGYLAKEFLGNVNNTIDTIFAKKVKTEELCIKDTCVTEEQLKALLNNVNSVQIQQPEQLQPNILENDPIAEEIEPEIPVSNLEIVAE